MSEDRWLDIEKLFAEAADLVRGTGDAEDLEGIPEGACGLRGEGAVEQDGPVGPLGDRDHERVARNLLEVLRGSGQV